MKAPRIGHTVQQRHPGGLALSWPSSALLPGVGRKIRYSKQVAQTRSLLDESVPSLSAKQATLEPAGTEGLNGGCQRSGWVSES